MIPSQKPLNRPSKRWFGVRPTATGSRGSRWQTVRGPITAMLGALLLCAAATGVESAQDDGDQCAGPRCVSAARVDDFSIDSSAEYTSSNDPSGSGLSSFTINAGATGLLRISIADGF